VWSFFCLFFLCYISFHTHVHKRAERRARNIAGAEALAAARRPEVASRIFVCRVCGVVLVVCVCV